jgi:hypothetical protein
MIPAPPLQSDRRFNDNERADLAFASNQRFH